MLLTGKTAIISGAAGARGIGFATAKTFAEQGARVAILDLDGAGAARAAAELGSGHLGLACNVTDKADCERAVSGVLKAFGKVDILINNAGITQPVKVWDIIPQDWDRIQDVNLPRRALSLAGRHAAHAGAEGWLDRLHVVGFRAARRRHSRRPALFGRQGRRAGPRQGDGPRTRSRQHPGQLRRSRPDQSPTSTSASSPPR